MTTDELLALIAANLPDNNLNQIRAQDLRAVLTALVTSLPPLAALSASELALIRHSYLR